VPEGLLAGLDVGAGTKTVLVRGGWEAAGLGFGAPLAVAVGIGTFKVEVAGG
jgi:hypothetical protein